MILLKYYGAGKIGIQLDEPTVQETKMVKRAVDLVGGGTSNLLGLHIHRDNIARFVDLVEGFHVEFDEEVKNLVYEETEVVLDILRQYEERAVRIADHVEMTLGIRPLPHQYEGSRWLVQKKKAILADDPGTGKTATTLLALPDNCAVLVEAPAMAIGVWKEHFEQWRPDYKVSVCLSEKKFRMPELGEAIIVSRGSLPPTVKEIQQMQEGTRSSRSGRTEAVTINAYALEMKSPFILIADEAHQFKSAGSLQTQKHRVLVREVVKKGGCVWMVTGTPLLNKPPDLWGVLQSTGCASEIFGGWLEFVRLFGGKQGPFGGYYWPDKHKDIDKLGKEVSEKLKHVMIRHTFEQVRPDLPLKRRHILTIPMDKVKDKKTWKEMEAAFSTLEAAGITVDQMLKMLDSGQASKLPINPFTLRKAMSVAKIPALLELVSSVEDEGEAVIVATAHSAPLEALRSRKGWVIIDGATPPMERKEIERKFQAGQFKGIGLSIQAGGLSLSLHRARRMIFVDLEWTPGENTQVEDRIRRVKQERGCIYTILTLDHNYEKKVMTSLINKAQVIDKTINVLAGKDPVYKSDQLSTLVERINGNSNKSISFNDLKNFLWTDMDHHVVFEILSKGIDGITEVEWVFLRNLAKSRKFV